VASVIEEKGGKIKEKATHSSIPLPGPSPISSPLNPTKDSGIPVYSICVAFSSEMYSDRSEDIGAGLLFKVMSIPKASANNGGVKTHNSTHRVTIDFFISFSLLS